MLEENHAVFHGGASQGKCARVGRIEMFGHILTTLIICHR